MSTGYWCLLIKDPLNKSMSRSICAAHTFLLSCWWLHLLYQCYPRSTSPISRGEQPFVLRSSVMLLPTASHWRRSTWDRCCVCLMRNDLGPVLNKSLCGSASKGGKHWCHIIWLLWSILMLQGGHFLFSFLPNTPLPSSLKHISIFFPVFCSAVLVFLPEKFFFFF